MVGAAPEAHHHCMNSQAQPALTPPPPPPPPAPPRAPRRYVRREEGKWLAGVCTGMADAFGIDVTVVRVLWVIVALGSFGVGVAAYALFWFAFPSEVHPAPISRSWTCSNRAHLRCGMSISPEAKRQPIRTQAKQPNGIVSRRSS